MENINISDSIHINDSERIVPKGIIRFYDESGNLVKEVHNMVVASGRKIIYKLFANWLGADISAPVKNSLSICLAYQPASNIVNTVPEITLTDVKRGVNTSTTNKSYYSLNLASSGTTVETDESNMIINFKLEEISADQITAFNEIFICGTVDSNEVLFSRAAMDPVYLSETSKYSCTYSIYF